MTASDASSSAAERPEAAARGVDLVAAGLLPPLPAAFLAGEALDLLAPLRHVAPGADLEIRPPARDREALAAALEVANASYGHPRAAELAARLADPATRVVVAGQQPGLLGGPLYTLSKAIAAARWAERLESTGRPAVAVFWVATEDHDFAEVARASVPGPDGLLDLDLGEDPDPLRPVGMRTLGPGIRDLLERLAGAIPGERYAAWVERLATWYRPDARFGEAFCRLMTTLLGERSPLLLDAMLPAVKEAERPWLEALVAQRSAVDAASARRDEAIRSAGFPLQVTPQRGASPLFLLRRGKRRRIEWTAEGFVLRGEGGAEEPVARLAEVLAENPAAVSPGVLARPAIQDAILGTSLFLVGPGELSYLPQAAPLYELLGIAPPQVALRPQIVVLEEHHLAKLAELDLTLAEMVAPDFDLDRALAGGAIAPRIEATLRELDRTLAPLGESALAVDASLERPWEKTRDQIHRALETFAGKLTAAAGRSDATRRQRAEDLRSLCRPRGAPQERVVATAHFPGKYGERFVDSFWNQLALDPSRLQVIQP